MAGYIYNPAENIRQGFQQTQSSLSNIFTQVIAQQQRDYNLAESAFQNIEALKKDINIFGQKNITDKSNQLLKKAGSAIGKDGKLNYEALGEIRQAVSDIKDLKIGYDLGAKEMERRLQLGIASKDDMDSFEKFYKEMTSLMADENLVRNPQDLMTRMSEVYNNNLSAQKIFMKSYLSANPYVPVSKDIIDGNGNKVRFQGEIPSNMMLDDKGNLVPKPPITQVVNGQTVTLDYVDQTLNMLKATDPTKLELMKRSLGSASSFMSEKDVVKYFIDKVPAKVLSTEIKSKAQLDTETNQATITGIGAKYAEKKEKAEIEGLELRNKGQILQNAGQGIQNKIGQMTLDSIEEEKKSSGASNEVFFANPRSMVMPIGTGATDVMGKSQKVSYNPKTGALMVSALKDTKSGSFNIPENASLATTELVPVPVTYRRLDSFKKSVLASALTGIEAAQKPIVRAQIENLFKKAKNGYLFPSVASKLSKRGSLPANVQRVPLSKVRELYESGQISGAKNINDAVEQALSQGIKVTNE